MSPIHQLGSPKSHEKPPKSSKHHKHKISQRGWLGLVGAGWGWGGPAMSPIRQQGSPKSLQMPPNSLKPHKHKIWQRGWLGLVGAGVGRACRPYVNWGRPSRKSCVKPAQSPQNPKTHSNVWPRCPGSVGWEGAGEHRIQIFFTLGRKRQVSPSSLRRKFEDPPENAPAASV